MDATFQSNFPPDVPCDDDGPELNALERALAKCGQMRTVCFNERTSHHPALIAFAHTHLMLDEQAFGVYQFLATENQWQAFTAAIAKWEEIPY